MRAALFAVLIFTLARTGEARLLLSQKDALTAAFPGAVLVERKTAYLSEEQARRAEGEAHAKLEARVWTYYVGKSPKGILGYAYFDTHVVRTMPETFMAVVAPDGSVRQVELLAFLEPDDYLPRRSWLDQFLGRVLDDRLMVRRAIRNITGASLTSSALADGVRRVLAVHAVILGKEKR